jgi:ribokinase
VTWVQPEDLLPHELAASRDEGRDVAAVAQRWAAAGGSLVPASGGAAQGVDPGLRALAVELLDACDALPLPSSEVPPPPSGSSTAPPVVDRDRLHRAWLGRAAGCLLGKPVEKLPREGIREILASTGRWPLSGYFTGVGLPAGVASRWPWNRRSAPNSLVENIDGMPEDDDLNFALLALRLLERTGRGFTSEDVATAWLEWLPAGRVFTAERVAYRNLLLGLAPPATARRHNPFREWIGAAIRADVYGWANPGRPGMAAQMAWRDAILSHTGGGVHGAMWVAAMTSAAVVVSDVEQVLDAGESVVPPGSRFAAAVREARALAAAEPDWEAVVDRLYERHGHLHWVHGRNNAALVAAALVHGGGDFTRSVCAVVSGGWDTDSNGATVGSVAGALAGVDPYWTDPLHDRLHTSLAGFDGVSFTELASRTARLSEILVAERPYEGARRPRSTGARVAVVGSANLDLVATGPSLPRPGETVLGHGFATVPGGKGANQAVAAARAGAACGFVGAVGDDAFAEQLRANLVDAGVDVSRLRTVPGPSGVALIAVDDAAENQIMVAPGANASLILNEADRAAIAAADVLLCQLEIPLPAVVEAAAAASFAILNAAPVRALPAELLDAVDLLVVNESEAVGLVEGGAPEDLLALVPRVVVTLGAEGAAYADREGTRLTVPAPRIEPVDTTAAGDAFCGALAVAWAERRPVGEALRWACTAGAACALRPGASTALPTREEIDALSRASHGEPS